jgi:UDP-N-acetylmuramate dehydrogenase
MLIHQDYSLKRLHTFGIDVKTKLFAEIFSDEDLLEIISDKKLMTEPKFILGGGSNILFTKNFNGLVIKISLPGIYKVDENEKSVLIEAGAGEVWDSLVTFCVSNNFGGIENLTLIPGSVGAAPIQNIGAYGQELSDTIESLKGIFIEDGTVKSFSKSDCNFSYRNSIFKKEFKNKFIITSLRLKLNKNPIVNLTYKQVEDEIQNLKINNPTITDLSKLVAKIRKSKLPHPDEIGNAGSFFKNPVVHTQKYLELVESHPGIISYDVDKNFKKIAAGWLIENCGWKGRRIGNVGTHQKHALIIVNYGDATGDEVMDFSIRIIQAVELKFGIRLENEVNIIN